MEGNSEHLLSPWLETTPHRSTQTEARSPNYGQEGYTRSPVFLPESDTLRFVLNFVVVTCHHVHASNLW